MAICSVVMLLTNLQTPSLLPSSESLVSKYSADGVTDLLPEHKLFIENSLVQRLQGLLSFHNL